MPGLGHSDYGAAELKREYNRDLGNALAVSIALHIGVLFFLNVTADPEKKPVDTRLADLTWMVDTSMSQPIHLESFGDTKYQPGGGGGNLETKAPEGKSIKGHPQAEPPKEAPKETKKPTNDLIAVKNPPKVRVVDRDPEPPNTGVAPRKDTSSSTPSVIGAKGDHPLGTGDKPAGGTGGPGIGHGSGSGVGYNVGGYGNRGWLVAPTAKYPDGAQSTGAVVLKFTAQPNGDITNIVPVKQADQALVRAAINGLKRARARPIPDALPQVPQSYVITYSFDIK